MWRISPVCRNYITVALTHLHLFSQDANSVGLTIGLHIIPKHVLQSDSLVFYHALPHTLLLQYRIHVFRPIIKQKKTLPTVNMWKCVEKERSYLTWILCLSFRLFQETCEIGLPNVSTHQDLSWRQRRWIPSQRCSAVIRDGPTGITFSVK